MKKYVKKKLIIFLYAFSLLGISEQIFASGFQLWEQDGASVGNYHAGYAALAQDASTAFYNPAGITRIKNQQLVLGAVGITTEFKYQGTVGVSSYSNGDPQPATAQGGAFGFVPALHYVAPITDRIGFGFSVDVPFGLQTDYGKGTFVRYASTLASVKVIDVSPSLGIQVTDKASIGFGPDFQRMSAEFDQMAVLRDPATTDTNSTNRADDTAWGYHVGGLYQFSENSRIGLSYHSQVVHHLSRDSTFKGPLADTLTNGTLVSQARANITLPPYTAFSVYQRVQPKLALMGSVIYTQWSSVRNLVMKNVAGISGVDFNPDTNLTVVIPQYFRNTWNVSLGADYDLTDKVTLKGAVGYDETPVKNFYRNVQLPDNNRYVIAFGGHYQATKTIGLDLGWMHLFMHTARVNPPPQITGDQVTTTNGHVTGGADVYGAQVTWDIV